MKKLWEECERSGWNCIDARIWRCVGAHRSMKNGRRSQCTYSWHMFLIGVVDQWFIFCYIHRWIFRLASSAPSVPYECLDTRQAKYDTVRIHEEVYGRKQEGSVLLQSASGLGIRSFLGTYSMMWHSFKSILLYRGRTTQMMRWWLRDWISCTHPWVSRYSICLPVYLYSRCPCGHHGWYSSESLFC